MLKNLIHFIAANGLVLACLLPRSSCAELGGMPDKDAVLLQDSDPNIPAAQYLKVVVLKIPGGSQIKEYVSPENKVVAVTWQGPTLPNLQHLLGDSYFKIFANHSADQKSANHRNAELSTDDLVVQSHGQMHYFSGRAYLPKLLPSGSSLDEIK